MISSDFSKLVSARFLYTLAVQMQAVILGWRIYELVGDPLALGFIGLTEALPAIGLALYAGFLVDRKAPLMIYRSVMVISLVSGLIVLFEHLLTGQNDVHFQAGLLYGAAFLTGLARSFSQPAIFASIPRLVPREDLPRATAVSSSALQTARILGPALGGIVFGFLGPVVASSLVCLSLFCGILVTISIKTKLSAAQSKSRHATITEELLSGAKFVFAHPILLPALSLDMISVLFGGVTALLPIFAKEILFIGPKGLGALRAAPAVGAAVMGIYLSRKPLKGPAGPWLFAAVAGFGVCILIFGLSTHYVLSMIALIGSGAFDSISMVIRSTAVQLSSPDHMRGKISAVNSMFIGSSNEIGEFESGVAAKLFGPVTSVYLGGIICLMTVAVVAVISPRLRRMDLKTLTAD